MENQSVIDTHLQRMLAGSKSILQHYAWRIVNIHNLKPEIVLMYCVQVVEPWHRLVELIHPPIDWESIRNDGLEPVAVGFTTWEKVTPELSEILPSLLQNIGKPLQTGKVRTLVLTKESAAVAQIAPATPSKVLLNI